MALTLAEREEISRHLVEGMSIRSIADRLRRAPSTVSREISRNGGLACYRATQADTEAVAASAPTKACKLVERPASARIVTAKLEMQWSREQIATWLKHTYPTRAFTCHTRRSTAACTSKHAVP
ncbi:helix-turn-helix domain-containing protein [Ramlibacter ginsenosidimutans]|uniref:Helix-turn-helix domain-containing protein n=1 Tax=Ramlibacter ginsenosidimutans TaxID=502333 RepID=A0A934TWT5_9BURK|nr:helix-turn-helix domain-containing protein [Ramlibacter ginsenosidimutans]